MKNGFKATRIQPINPKAMDRKTRLSNVYAENAKNKV